MFRSEYLLAANPQKPLTERRAAYERSLRACPALPRLYREFADLLEANGFGAEASYHRAIAYRLQGKHKAAQEEFSRAWDRGYQNDYVLYSLVEEDHALGEKQAGLTHFRLLLLRYPESAWVDLLLADAGFAKDQNEEAANEYRKALTKKPDLLEANFRLGYLAFQSGDMESAARYFRNEIAVNPSYVDAHLFLAESLAQLDRREASLAELRAALTLDPNSALTYKRLATTLIDANQLGEAARTLKSAELRFPQDPAFPAQRARVLRLMHQEQKAQAEAELARTLTARQHAKQEIAPRQ